MVMFLEDGVTTRFSFKATFLLMKLSELPESNNAFKTWPFKFTFVIACDKLWGEPPVLVHTKKAVTGLAGGD